MVLAGIERAKKADEETNNNIRGNYMGKLGVPGSTQAAGHMSVQTDLALMTSGRDSDYPSTYKSALDTNETSNPPTERESAKQRSKPSRHSTNVQVQRFERSPTLRTQLTFGEEMTMSKQSVASKEVKVNNLAGYMGSRSSMDVTRWTNKKTSSDNLL